jgi:hypothetical protein
VQIETQISPDGCAAAYKHPLVLWVLFDDPPIEDGFNDVLALKTFLQGISHRVASDKIVSSPHSFTDDLDGSSSELDPWPRLCYNNNARPNDVALLPGQGKARNDE